MSTSRASHEALNLRVSTTTTTTNSDRSLTDVDNYNGYHSIEQYLTFNILGKIYYVKENLFQSNSNLFHGTLLTEVHQLEEFYDQNREQYVIDISPLIFDKILQYYTIQKLLEPSNIHIDYFKEMLDRFHIDTSALDIDKRYERFVSRQGVFQLIHVVLEYSDSCRFAQILHYICSMIALLSCLLVSLSFTSRDLKTDLHIWNTTITEIPTRSKAIIAHFRNQPSNIFIIDTLCLAWAIGETILRTLSTPSLYHYFTTLGLFDITGVIFHLIYIYTIGSGTKPSRCQLDSIHNLDTFSCITFNRRLMILNLFRKLRLVRYIRPLKHFVLSLIASKKEITRLIVLISFIILVFAPLIFIIESSYISECSSTTTTIQIPMIRCIRTISDACYYIILIISTVGYGDVYPMSQLARFISMLVSPFSIMILSVPLASIYSKYTTICESYQMQLAMPENIRYLTYDNSRVTEQYNQFQKQEMMDVTERINRSLQYLGISRQLQEELDRKKNKF